MNSNLQVAYSAVRAARCAAVFALALIAAAFTLLAGCGPVRLVASTHIPEPLVVKIPVTVALFMPPEFSEYVHVEERWGTDWNIEIGNAQTGAITRLMDAMFDRVIAVDSLNAGAQLGSDIRAILEPSVEEYAFVTPRDAGSPFFAVSIKYRVNVYTPDGKLADSWGFTGYGTAPAGGLSHTEPLEDATALAMRDAGAKLAVEFREQAIVRGLLPEAGSATDPAMPSALPAELPAAAPETETESDPGGDGAEVQDEGLPEAPSGISNDEDEATETEPTEAPEVDAFAWRGLSVMALT